MERRLLGRTGLSVSVLGVGGGTFGAFGLKDESTCVRTVHEALDAGVNLIDTADFYGFGLSETLTGKMIADRRDKVIVATKCGMPMSRDPNERGGSRRWINLEVDRSLKRLNTDYIDLYQLHMPDPSTEIEETIDAMNALMRAGKIRAYGTSNFSGLMCAEAQLRARLQGQVPPHTEQSSYSIFARGPESELLPACHKYNVGFFAYSPLDGGWLSGKYRRGAPMEKSARQKVQPERFDIENPAIARKLDAAEALVGLAQEAGLTLAELATGFVLAHKAVTCALVGGSKPEHFQAHVLGKQPVLSEDVLDRIDEIVPPGAAMPPAERTAFAVPDKDLRRHYARLPQKPAAAASDVERIMRTQAPKR